jgi:hypothetical protein
MGIFSKKPLGPEAQKVKEIIEKVQREHEPVFELGLAIASAAMQGGQAMRSKITADSEDKATEQLIYVCYEFLYFFHALNGSNSISKARIRSSEQAHGRIGTADYSPGH